jgi:putative sterol carrier protein
MNFAKRGYRMTTIFPSPEWMKAMETKLNTDEKYAQVAKNWEGDLMIIVEPQGNLQEQIDLYWDLWHGKCRKVLYNGDTAGLKPQFSLRATYDVLTSVLLGKLDPMAAMLTNRLHVKGNMGYMMRNVPTVLDFVRCAREITHDIL